MDPTDSLYGCRFDVTGGVWIWIAGDWVHFKANAQRAKGPCDDYQWHPDGHCTNCTWREVAHEMVH